MKIIVSFLLMVLTTGYAMADAKKLTGKKVFETYCWGCHHQTAVAFGPPFSEMAAKRSPEVIRAMIAAPKEVSKTLGYRRSAMPPFVLTEDEISAITKYILSYKESNTTKEPK